MNRRPSPHQHPDVAARGNRIGVALATLLTLTLTLTLLALAGCGLRTETPAPVEPSPGAVEQVRARTVADSLALAAAARAVAATTGGAADPVAAVVADIASFSDQHADAAGGTYVSGLPTPTAGPNPTTAASTTGPADVAGLLAQLADSSTTALADADAVDDGPLARLVASIATSRAELTTRLAQAAGVAAPAVGPAAAAPPATPAPSPSTSTTTAPAAVADLDALTLAHDQAGYGFEVIAAKLTGERRTTARASAAEHRSQSEHWARASGSDGTASDPRRASYALPTGLADPATATALGRTLETAVADAYANAVGSAPAGARTELLDGLRAATTAAAVWGATPIPFPGLPEQTQQPTG